MDKDKKSNNERLFEYLMKITVQTPNNYELGAIVRELAIKKGYYGANRESDQGEE